MIRPTAYKTFDDTETSFRYVTYGMVRAAHTAEELKRFDNFMRDVTWRQCALLDGEAAIHSNDYEKWLKLEGG
jgi:hypothetical protein